MNGKAMTQDAARELALRWAGAGVPAFPIKLRWDEAKQGVEKEPFKGTHGFYDATTEVEKLSGMFNGATLPTGWCWGVGLHLGPAGLMALDVDIKNGARGDEELRALEEEQGPLPVTPTVVTPSGGSHVWLAKGERAVSNVDLVKDQIEVRSDNGFVVAPGTFCPWGRWDFDDTAGDVLDGAAVADAPGWVFEILDAGGSDHGGAGGHGRHWRDVDLDALHPANAAALKALGRLGGHGAYMSRSMEDGVAVETLRVTRPGKTSGTGATVGYSSPGSVRLWSSNWTLFEPNVAGPRLHGGATYDADDLADVAAAVEAGDRAKAERLADPFCWMRQDAAAAAAAAAGSTTTDVTTDGALRVADVERERVRWIWARRLPLGKVTMLDGDPGLGKSTLTCDVAARLTRGKAMPDGGGLDAPANVLIMSAEDGAGDTIRPRLEAAGADLDRVFLFDRVVERDERTGEEHHRPVELPFDLARIRRVIEERNITLVVIDPLVAFLGAKTDSHRDQDVRRVLYPLAQLASDTGAAVLCLRHLNKAGGSNALYRGGGSIGFIGAARIGLLVARHPEDPNRRVLAGVKNNLAPEADSLVFRLDSSPMLEVACIAWQEGTSILRADDLLRCPDRERPAPQRDRATELLEEMLAHEPRLRIDIEERAKDEGISWRTVETAKAALGVESRQVPVPGQRGAGPSWWYLE